MTALNSVPAQQQQTSPPKLQNGKKPITRQDLFNLLHGQGQAPVIQTLGANG